MAEDNKGGHAKITIDIEINESLMEVMKESMENMPAAMQMIEEQSEKK